ncbi:TIGR03759 family integrating conjugative element protein [Achromobacter xylosoxidans]
MHSRIIPIFLLACATAVAAAPPVPAERTSQVQAQKVEESELAAQRAGEWGLQPEEWTRYQALMEGPLGIYSPNLDPLTALGIQARSDAERRRYAELQARAEAQHTERLLAYQRAYDEAWRRLYPDQPRVQLTGERSAAGMSEDGRLAVFVKADCPACTQRVQQLQATGTAFDVYVVGTRGEDARVRQWAQQAAVDPAKVRTRAITLNHDGGRWLSLGLSGELPAVVRQVNGQWQRR